MSFIRALGRHAGTGAARLLCSRYGTATVLAASLALAGDTSYFLGQHATQATPPTPATDTGQAAGCWAAHEIMIVYLPELNGFYCPPYHN